MKITCERDKISAAFAITSAVAPSRSPKPILQNVKMDIDANGAVMMATDLEVGIRVDLDGVDAEVPGSVVLPVGPFRSILHELSDPTLRIETDGKTILVRGQHSEFNLPAQNPDEFPKVAAFESTKYQQLPARFLRELIRRTAFATDNESTRYALGGVLLEFAQNEITAVGTDGRRLAKMQGAATAVGGHEDLETNTIIPTRAMQLIDKAIGDRDGEVQIAARNNDVLLFCEGLTVYSRLVEGRFPRWRDVLPVRENAARIEMLVGPFSAAVRQAAIVSSNDSRGIDFTFADGKLVLTGASSDYGQSRVEMPLSYDQDPLTITLDPRYVTDFLRVLNPDKTITMELSGAESASVCTTDDGYAYVIMPLARDA